MWWVAVNHTKNTRIRNSMLSHQRKTVKLLHDPLSERTLRMARPTLEPTRNFLNEMQVMKATRLVN